MDLVVDWIPQWLCVFDEVESTKLLAAEKVPSLYEWS